MPEVVIGGVIDGGGGGRMSEGGRGSLKPEALSMQ